MANSRVSQNITSLPVKLTYRYFLCMGKFNSDTIRFIEMGLYLQVIEYKNTWLAKYPDTAKLLFAIYYHAGINFRPPWQQIIKANIKHMFRKIF